MSEKTLKEKILLRRRIFKGKYIKLDSLRIRLPDGRIGEREIVSVRDAVGVLPVDADGRVHLVRQSRPAVSRILTEIPAGLIDEGETPEEAARRECEEETGLRPGSRRDYGFRSGLSGTFH